MNDSNNKNPNVPLNVLIDLDSPYGSYHNKFRELFRKSDALTQLKELNAQLTPAQFIKFTNVALKSAYDFKKHKAVTYMLGFREPNEPLLLLKIHLGVLFEDINKDPKRNMLKAMLTNFSADVCFQHIESLSKVHPFNHPNNQSQYQSNKKELEFFILNNNLPQNTTSTSKRVKI